MMDPQEFSDWCNDLGLSEEAKNLITMIRSSPPVRRVRSRVGNVPGFYASKKMGKTIQFESHTVELCGIYEMENSDKVIEFYDQPNKVKLTYPSLSGRKVGVLGTPDFFVLNQTSGGWEEWKEEDELIRLMEKQPNRYVRNADGSWRCPPGEGYAQKFGLYYRIRASSEINWTVQRNLRFLEDYLRDEENVLSQESCSEIFEILTENQGITIASILEELKCSDVDDLYYLVSRNEVFVDLERYALAEPTSVHLFTDKLSAEAHDIITRQADESILDPDQSILLSVGRQILWNAAPWTIINLGEDKISLQSNQGETVELFNSSFDQLVSKGSISGLPSVNKESNIAAEMITNASPADLEEAVRRYNALTESSSDIPPRTLRRWRKQFTAASEALGNGFVGLLPQHQNKGNRQSKLDDKVLDIMNTAISEEYETHKQIDRSKVWGDVVNQCEESGLIGPSYKTFCLAVKQRPQYEQLKARKGSRAAYNLAPEVWYLSPSTPRHGDRPFEIAHIDHTESNVELIDDKGNNLGKPWTTYMTDGFSRRILAIYVTFDKPSYRSCMMVMRECVRRHGRLPATMIVDGGKEFHSVYFDALLARYECHKKQRPPSQPRFGSIVERLFGTTNTEFIDLLSGSSKMTHENARLVTKEVNPKNHAAWTLHNFYRRLSNYVYELYDTLYHSSLGDSPRQTFTEGLASTGMRPYRRIAYTQSFILSTLPTTRKGTAKLDPSHGVKINYIYYWSDVFRDPKYLDSQLEVRYDPWDMSLAYVYVGKQWVKCISEYAHVFKGRTEKEIRIAVEVLRRKNRDRSKNFLINARRLADFLRSIEAEEMLSFQRVKDQEQKDVHQGPINSTDDNSSNDEPQPNVRPISIDPSKIPVFDEFQ